MIPFFGQRRIEVARHVPAIDRARMPCEFDALAQDRRGRRRAGRQLAGKRKAVEVENTQIGGASTLHRCATACPAAETHSMPCGVRRPARPVRRAGRERRRKRLG